MLTELSLQCRDRHRIHIRRKYWQRRVLRCRRRFALCQLQSCGLGLRGCGVYELSRCGASLLRFLRLLDRNLHTGSGTLEQDRQQARNYRVRNTTRF